MRDISSGGIVGRGIEKSERSRKKLRIEAAILEETLRTLRTPQYSRDRTWTPASFQPDRDPKLYFRGLLGLSNIEGSAVCEDLKNNHDILVNILQFVDSKS
jgi:hypothetical protein